MAVRDGDDRQAPVNGQRPRRSWLRSQGRRTANRATYSALDLGTNNCRLLIAKPVPGGFRVIDAFSRIVRLGEGVTQTGRLSEPAMTRTIEALQVCARKIERRRVTCMRHVATEACRSAANADAFVSRVRSETGLNLDIISPAEEARLAVLGCQTLLDAGRRHAIVFDIGGGSTELIWVEQADGDEIDIRAWTSLPLGVVTLSERFDRTCISPQVYRQMIELVADQLDLFEAEHGLAPRIDRGEVQLLGTSGTVTTLASLALKLTRYDRNKVDGALMDTADIRRLSRKVALMDYDERAAQPCIGPERADLVVPGCAILDAILAKWPVARLRIADRGIREGLLRGLMRSDPVVNGDHGDNGDRGGRPDAAAQT